MPILDPFRIRLIKRNLTKKTDKLTVLDIGCGNHSVKRIKNYFPGCSYHGLDNGVYNNDQSDFEMMDQFYQVDFNKDNLDEVMQQLAVIPDGSFDLMIMHHVIEHLWHGDQVVIALIKKLKPGGLFYIEYPGVRSLSLPSLKGTLNFDDDDTHVRIYSVKELANLFINHSCRPLKGGVKRDYLMILFSPILFFKHLILHHKTSYVFGGLWDICGFAEFILARKS